MINFNQSNPQPTTHKKMENREINTGEMIDIMHERMMEAEMQARGALDKMAKEWRKALGRPYGRPMIVRVMMERLEQEGPRLREACAHAIRVKRAIAAGNMTEQEVNRERLHSLTCNPPAWIERPGL